MRRTITKRTPRAYGRSNDMAECHDVTYEQTNASPKHLRRRGFAFVWTALVVLAIFFFVGLSIDRAKLLYNVHELQNAADAAALAGAQIVKVWSADETRQWTSEIGYANKAEKLEVTLRTTAQADPFTDETDLDIILGRWINNQHYFFETLDTPDAVKVIARRADGLTDAPALARLLAPPDVHDVDALRVAIGWYNETSGAGLIVLDERPVDKQGNQTPGLLIADNVGDIRVIGGSIHVNTVWEGTKQNNTPPAAVYVKAGGTMLSARLTVTGHTDPEPPTEDNLNGWDDIWMDDTLAEPMEMPYDIDEGAPYMPDPLRDLVPPTIPTDPNDANNYIVKSYTKNTSARLDPGYYPDGIEMTTDGVEVNLNPGTYIIGGGNEQQCSGLIQTGGTLNGYGVLIYLTKDYGASLTNPNDDGNWAQLDIGGNVVTNITPPGDEMDPKVINGIDGVSFWQDRENTQNQAELAGGGSMMISGTLYFPNNHVYLAGNPGKAGNQILCGSVEVFGRAQIVVEYDGRNNQHKGVSVLVK